MTIQTRLEDMVIGDKITCAYGNGTGGQVVVSSFHALGNANVYYTLGSPSAQLVGTYYFHFIYIGKDYKGRMILVADRNVQHSVSWDALNSAMVATSGGCPINTLGLDPAQWKTNIRLLTGGVDAADAPNSEWDKYIVNSTLGGTITAGDNTVWNWNATIQSWTSTVTTIGSTYRALRGYNTANGGAAAMNSALTSRADSITAFRPVLVAESLTPALPPVKYLIQEGSEIKKYTTQWETVTSVDVTEADFLTHGMDSIDSIPESAWNALGDTFEVLQWVSSVPASPQEVEYTIDPVHPIYLLDNPKVLAWTDDPEWDKSLSLTAVPHPQLVLPVDDISLSGGVEKVNVVGSPSSLLASGDSGSSWKSYKNGAWTSVNVSDLEDVKANGMTATEVNALTKEQLNELAVNEKIRFAYYLEQEKTSDTVNVDEVSITPSPFATDTPTLDSISVKYDELTIEGRLKELEEINAINLAKLNFKSNAFLLSEKYNMHDMMVDTFESDSLKTIKNGV
jgi:hypothetical protein